MSDGRNTTKTIKVTEHCHARLDAYARESETFTGAVERAIDNAERFDSLIDEFPEDVSQVLAERLADWQEGD